MAKLNKKTTNVKVNKVARKSAPLSSMSLFQLRLGIFAMAFAILGIWTYIFASAATYNVRFVFFCGVDTSTDTCSGSVTSVNSTASTVRSFYGRALGVNETFTLLPTVFVRGTHSTAYYNDGSSDASNNTIMNIYNDPNMQPYLNSTTKVMVILGFTSMANCGIGGNVNGEGIGVFDPLQVKSSGWHCSSMGAAGIAHELGHTFLASSSADHTGDQRLMDTARACNYDISTCTITQTSAQPQRTTIAGRPWINAAYSTSTAPAPAPAPAPSSPYNESGISTYSCTGNPHPTIKRGSSGNCVKHVQWILINKYSSCGGAYVRDNGGVDGGFGAGTEQGVKKFQSCKGLTADGIVGPKTWDILH